MANRQDKIRASENALADAVHRDGLTLHQAHARMRAAEEEGLVFTGMTVRAPRDNGEDYFVIVRATQDGQQVVAFHSAETLASAVGGALRKFYNRTHKWREDAYARDN